MMTTFVPYLCLIAQQPEGHRVRDGEGEEAKVEGSVVKLEVNSCVGTCSWVSEALAEQRKPRTLPA